jgi:hypothetical protein
MATQFQPSADRLAQVLKDRTDIMVSKEIRNGKTNYFIAPSVPMTWDRHDGYQTKIKDFLQSVADKVEHVAEPELLVVELDVSVQYGAKSDHFRDTTSSTKDIGVLKVSPDVTVFAFKDEESAQSALDGLILDDKSGLGYLVLAVKRD